MRAVTADKIRAPRSSEVLCGVFPRKNGAFAMRGRRVGSILRSPSSPRARSPRPGAVWLVDNYDSFTENLAHGLATFGADVVVVRNDATTPRRVLAARPAGVVLSPGPCTPA